MAYKIVYGSGQTIARRSESSFSGGYGFLAMHREEAVKDFAFDVLEERLLGKTFYQNLKRGPEWNGPIIISSFQHCHGWNLLSKVRPISESRGRAYFIAEFLLCDDQESKRLAGEKVTPADILRSDNPEIWHQGKMWDSEGAWYSEPIDLCLINRKENFCSEPAEAAGGFAPNQTPEQHPGCLAPFAHSECLWAAARTELDPGALLEKFSESERAFVNHYGPRLAECPEGQWPFSEVCWRRITFTNFYVDPDTGIDFHLDESRADSHPYTWIGAWEGVPIHLSDPPEVIEIGPEGPISGAPDEQLMIEAGWINEPIPEAAPETGPAEARQPGRFPRRPAVSLTALPARKRPSRRNVRRNPPKEQSWLKWAAAVGIGLAIIFLGWKFVRSGKEKQLLSSLNSAWAEKDVPKMGKLLGSNPPGGDEFRKFRNQVEDWKNLKKHFLEISTLGKNGKLVRVSTPSRSPDPSLLPKAWSTVEVHRALLALTGDSKKNTKEAEAEELDILIAFFKRWQTGADAREKTFEELANSTGLQSDYEKAVLGRARTRFEGLLKNVEDQAGPKASKWPDGKPKSKKPAVISDAANRLFAVTELPSAIPVLGEFTGRLSALKGESVPPGKVATVPSDPKVTAVPDPGDTPPAPADAVPTTVKFASMDSDGYYEIPSKDREVRWFDGLEFFKGGIWWEGAFRIPPPDFADFSTKQKVVFQKSSVLIGRANIAKVGSKEKRFKFNAGSTGTGSLPVFVIKNPEEEGGFEARVFRLPDGETEYPVESAAFFPPKGKKTENLIEVTGGGVFSLRVFGGEMKRPVEVPLNGSFGPEEVGRSIAAKITIDKDSPLPMLPARGAAVFRAEFWGDGKNRAPILRATLLKGVHNWKEVEVDDVNGKGEKIGTKIKQEKLDFGGGTSPIEERLKTFESFKKYLAAGKAKKRLDQVVSQFLYDVSLAIGRSDAVFPDLTVQAAVFRAGQWKEQSDLKQFRTDLEGAQDFFSGRYLPGGVFNQNGNAIRANYGKLYKNLDSLIAFTDWATNRELEKYPNGAGIEAVPFIDRIDAVLRQFDEEQAKIQNTKREREAFTGRILKGDFRDLTMQLIVDPKSN